MSPDSQLPERIKETQGHRTEVVGIVLAIIFLCPCYVGVGQHQVAIAERNACGQIGHTIFFINAVAVGKRIAIEKDVAHNISAVNRAKEVKAHFSARRKERAARRTNQRNPKTAWQVQPA